MIEESDGVLHNEVNTDIDWVNNEWNSSKPDHSWSPLKDSFVILKRFNFLELFVTGLDEESNNVSWDQNRGEALEDQSVSKSLDDSRGHHLVVVVEVMESLVETIAEALSVSEGITWSQELGSDELERLSGFVGVSEISQSSVSGEVDLSVVVPFVQLVNGAV